jgi:quercetin dioxygenase-like cupin family protein
MSLIKVAKLEAVHTDDRGSIFDVLNKPVSHIGMITFKEGVVRARHYHHESTQYDYIVSGKLKLVVCLPDGSLKEEYILESGMTTEVPPGIVHAYKALEDSVMLDITTLSREDQGYEDDTARVDLNLFD